MPPNGFISMDGRLLQSKRVDHPHHEAEVGNLAGIVATEIQRGTSLAGGNVGKVGGVWAHAISHIFNGKCTTTGFSPSVAGSKPGVIARIYTAVEFEFNAATGSSYRIEASMDLENWNPIETGVPGNGNLTRRLYPTRGNPSRFFRVAEE